MWCFDLEEDGGMFEFARKRIEGRQKEEVEFIIKRDHGNVLDVRSRASDRGFGIMLGSVSEIAQVS